MKEHRVVITGGGVVSALGGDWPSVEASLRARRNQVKTMADWALYKRMNTRLAAPVDWTPPEFSRKKTRGMGRVALMAVHAAYKALEQAGLLESPVLTSGQMGISFGSSTGSVDALLDFYSMLNDHDTQGITATTYIRSMPQTCAVNIGVFFGINGRLLTTNTACTAGSLSIGLAYEAIRYGHQKLMVCGGAEELNPTESAVFDTLFATSTKNDTPELTPRPYDKDRDGLVIGEGAGALVLENLEHALERGAPILAEIVGFGTNTDGDHITQPNQKTMEIALRLALASAGLQPEQIDLVNGHGTATAHGDKAESWATYNTFGRAIPMHTLKSYIGHTLGACGAIETWAGLHMMNAGWFSPNLNLVNPDPECAPLGYIMGEGLNLEAEHIMCNNFAFGGINTSLILKRWRA